MNLFLEYVCFMSTVLTDYIVPHELQNFIYIDFFDNIPETFNDILYALLTDSLKLNMTRP